MRPSSWGKETRGPPFGSPPWALLLKVRPSVRARSEATLKVYSFENTSSDNTKNLPYMDSRYGGSPENFDATYENLDINYDLRAKIWRKIPAFGIER
jgi:hypothetical protein